MIQEEYVLFAIQHKCNSKCNICFIEGEDGELRDLHIVSMPLFKRFLEAIPKGKYPGIIFSGGEVTLNGQLPEYASYARTKGFRNIMIQTNARALSDLRKTKELKSAGINQFFVSFHGDQNELSDKITGRSGAHVQTVKGLENLAKLDLMVITNTVMCLMNYTVLPEIGKFLEKFSNIVEMQFWGYMPMSLKAADLILPYPLAAPYLNKTIKYLVKHDRGICVKYFPVCLLDDPFKKFHKNYQSISFGVNENFYKREESCGYQKYPCCKGTDCWGLPKMYKSTAPLESWMPSIKTGGR